MEKITFQSKEEHACPVCDTVFHREELLSGGGRLIAGQLTDELHRLYQPSIKYGDVYPLVYQATVCPKCWFASTEKDFNLLPKDVCFNVSEDEESRKEEVNLVFPNVDFYEARDVFSGAAAQYLVMKCYGYYEPKFSPTVKQGIASLRAAWLLEELH
ncbi:MAG: DUF2225 domain-containing protein, partial [Treponema sp.]|nr:DUF2225 domain-containing protein [Treponema sp.]